MSTEALPDWAAWHVKRRTLEEAAVGLNGKPFDPRYRIGAIVYHAAPQSEGTHLAQDWWAKSYRLADEMRRHLETMPVKP